jgi:hypothetical protein
MPRRLSVLLVGVLAVLAAGGGTAEASRPATRAERAAILKPTMPYVRRNVDPYALRTLRVTGVRVSTVNRRWARVGLWARKVGRASVLLRLTPRRGWQPRDIGSSFACSEAPRGVIRDLMRFC